MTTKKTTMIGALLGAILTPALTAQREVQGESSRGSFAFAGEQVTSASAKWRLSDLLGEPTKHGTFRYTTASGRTLPYDTFVILRLQDSRGGGGFVAVAPDSVPASGAGYGGSTAGSPTWSHFIARRVRDGQLLDFYDAGTAKAAYKSGLRVVSWSLASPRSRQIEQQRRQEAADEARRQAEEQRERYEAEQEAAREREEQRREQRQEELRRAAEERRQRFETEQAASQERARLQREREEQRRQELAEDARRRAEQQAELRKTLQRGEEALRRKMRDGDTSHSDDPGSSGHGNGGHGDDGRNDPNEDPDEAWERRRQERQRVIQEGFDSVKRELDKINQRNQQRLDEHLERLRREAERVRRR